jgi:hypothetical protein
MRSTLAFAICGVVAVTTRAEAPAGKATDDELRIRGIFDSALPGTERKNSLRLIVHPHFGDLLQRDYLRVPFGLRYGLNERLELTGETEAFFAHGLGGVSAFNGFGLSSLHLGTKYQLGRLPDTDWDTAVGFDFTRPIGNPPTDITDGLKHLSPYVSFSRRLTSAPDWRVFWSIGYDEVRTTALPTNLNKNQLGADASTLSGGFLHERGPKTYTLEMAWSTSRMSRKFDHDVFTVRPGFVWVVPPRFTWGYRGRWVLGAALRLAEGPDGFDVGVSTKLRVNFNFRSLWLKSSRERP